MKSEQFGKRFVVIGGLHKEMKKIVLLLIVVLLFTSSTLLAEENLVNDNKNPKEITFEIITQTQIQCAGCTTIRIKEIKKPLTVKGSKDLENITLKLLGESKEIDRLELNYEILSDEIWLEFDWTLLEQHNSDYEIEVEIPEHMSLVIRQAEQDVCVSHIAGLDIKTKGHKTTLSSVKGLVRIRDNGGNLVLKDISGDIWISDFGGTIEVENAVGFVVIDSDALLNLKISNIEGDVTISAQQGGLAEIKGIKGNVSVFARAPIKTDCSDINGNLLLP